jgi:hypothetical protein
MSTIAAESVATPRTSTCLIARWSSAGRTRAAASATAAPMGTLTRKIARQSVPATSSG